MQNTKTSQNSRTALDRVVSGFGLSIIGLAILFHLSGCIGPDSTQGDSGGSSGNAGVCAVASDFGPILTSVSNETDRFGTNSPLIALGANQGDALSGVEFSASVSALSSAPPVEQDASEEDAGAYRDGFVARTTGTRATDTRATDTRATDTQPAALSQSSSGSGSESARIIRERAVKVNLDAFKFASRVASTSSVRLELFPDRIVDIEVEKVERPEANNVIVTGHVAGQELSHVSLVMRNDVLVGNLRLPLNHENFEIRYAGNGIHNVREVQLVAADEVSECAAVPADSEINENSLSWGSGVASPSDSPPASPPLSQKSSLEGDTQESLTGVWSDPVIDVLAAYTPNARNAEGGTDAIIALIQMGVADTNAAFEASGVALSVRLVGTIEVQQNESSFSSDLSALKSKTDGKWDEVHAERARLGADQVSMVGYYTASGTAGIGYINASVTSAFTITRTTAFGQYTFSHELGHNLGLRHEDGYENVSGRFRTIMAYGSYPRIRRFSNPALTYKTYATSGGSQNSAAILNANAVRVSSLVSSVLPIDENPPTDPPEDPIACSF